MEKRPRHKGDFFAVCPPSPKDEVGDALLEGKVVPPFWTTDARRLTSTKWLQGPHDEAAHPSRRAAAVAEAVLWRSNATRAPVRIAWRRGWVSGLLNLLGA